MVNEKGRPRRLAEEDKRSNKHQLAVRLTEDERGLVDRIARQLRCSSSEVMRRALAAFAERFK